MKNPLTPAELELVTFRFVAQHNRIIIKILKTLKLSYLTIMWAKIILLLAHFIVNRTILMFLRFL